MKDIKEPGAIKKWLLKVVTKVSLRKAGASEETIMKVSEYLTSRSFWTGVLAIVGSATMMYTKEVSYPEGIYGILGGMAIIFVRSAVAKIPDKVAAKTGVLDQKPNDTLLDLPADKK